MKEYTEAELKVRAEAYCSKSEHCPAEVREKLRQWGAEADVADRILAALEKARFVDAARFCRAFVRDKYRFNQWGRMKIVQALRMKRLSSEDIESGLAEIDEEEYTDVLKTLLAQKARSLKGGTEYERNTKLIRFAVSRGFEMDEVLRYVKHTDEYLD